MVNREDATPHAERLAAARRRPRRHQVSFVNASSILTRATGFISGFDYTLNPYGGCAFGCSYCYAAFFPREANRREAWGQWVDVKANALLKLSRLRRPLKGKSVYIGSVTDPYQPIERELELVRDLLPVMRRQGLRPVIQTRSPLVVRDADRLRQFDRVGINMTVTTDSDTVRQAFEPRCPTNEARLAAVAELRAAGLPCTITLTPLLPVENPETFARQLLATGVRRFVIQSFHPTRGHFVAGTGTRALDLARGMQWNERAYRQVRRHLAERLPELREGREGFDPAFTLGFPVQPTAG